MSAGVEVGAGVLLVGAHHINYVVEACESAEVIRDVFPDLPIALFTDLADDFEVDDDVFDHILPLEPCHDYPDHTRVGGKLNKIRAMRRSPFKKTLYIDAHAKLAHRDVASIFSTLDEYHIALVEAQLGASWSRDHYGRRIFLSGVIAFRRCDLVERFLADWEAVTKRQFDLAFTEEPIELPYLDHVHENVRRPLTRFDQVALASLLSPEHSEHGLNVKNLDERWNFRLGRPIPDEPIMIDTRTTHKRSSEELLEFTEGDST